MKVSIALLSLKAQYLHAWTTARTVLHTRPTAQIFQYHRFMAQSTNQEEFEEENPCWQNMIDDDCAMESAESATFIASEWIKSMPCGEGIEDCDMPADLQTPEIRAHGLDHTDVMDFLGLKRAAPVGKKDASEDEGDDAIAP